MAWIEGEEERTFVVNVSTEAVLTYFADPNQFRDANEDVELIEDLGDGLFRFTLLEKNEKGIKYQGVYDVEYVRDGDEVTWASRDGGNMRTTGSVTVKSLGDEKTEVTYQETLAPDLPIPKLMAKIFKPIVAREVSRGIGTFVDQSKKLLES